MRPLVFIPVDRRMNMEQADKLASEVGSFLVDGYICRVEHDALGEPNPTCLVIFSKDK